MSIENAIKDRVVLLERIGKSALNMKYPKEFELYVIALELVDGEGNTLKYFIFPVNPSNLDEMSATITSVKKTLTGVVSLINPTFTPIDINLSGSFGRKFKILLGTNYIDFLSSFVNDKGKVTKDSVEKGIEDFFDDRIKTGFGCLNVLNEILELSRTVDDKGPRSLIFHNLPFGTAYVVEHIATKTSMSQETNMIHNYSVTLKAIAPLDALKGTDLEDERRVLATTGYIQSQTDRLVQGLTKIF